MGIRMIERVLLLSVDHVSRSERLVLLALANFSARDGTSAYPSIATIGRCAGLSRRQVRRLLQTLEARRFIHLDAPAVRHRPKTYRLTLVEGTSDGPPKLAVEGTFRTGRGDILNAEGGHLMSPDPGTSDPGTDPGACAPQSLSKKLTEEELDELEHLAHESIDADPTFRLFHEGLDALKQQAATRGIAVDARVLVTVLKDALASRSREVRQRTLVCDRKAPSVGDGHGARPRGRKRTAGSTSRSKDQLSLPGLDSDVPPQSLSYVARATRP